MGQAGDGQRDHGFRRHARRGHHANVRSLVARGGFLAGIEADRLEGAAQGGNRLQISAHHDVLAVGDAAFDAAGVVLRAGKAGGLAGVGGRVVDGVVDLGAEGLGRGDAAADFDRLDRLQAHHGPGQQAVEALVPVGVGAQAGRHPVRDDFEDAVDGVAGAGGFFDFLLHAGFGFRVHAGQDHFVAGDQRGDLFPGGGPVHFHAAHADDVAQDLDAEGAQHQLGNGAGGHACGGFARGGPLQDVAGVGEIVFEGAGEVGVAGTRRSDGLVLGGIAGLDGELFFPVLPVAVDDLDGDGRADGFAVAHAGEEVGLVGLDLHAAAAAVALLAAPKLAVYELEIDGNAGGNARNQGDEGLAVRLPCGGKANHVLSIV